MECGGIFGKGFRGDVEEVVERKFRKGFLPAAEGGDEFQDIEFRLRLEHSGVTKPGFLHALCGGFGLGAEAPVVFLDRFNQTAGFHVAGSDGCFVTGEAD